MAICFIADGVSSIKGNIHAKCRIRCRITPRGLRCLASLSALIRWRGGSLTIASIAFFATGESENSLSHVSFQGILLITTSLDLGGNEKI